MIDTKAEREYAEEIYKYTIRCDEAAKHIDRLADEVDRLRKELDSRMHIDVWLKVADHRGEQTKWDTLLAAAKVCRYGDCDTEAPYKALREAIAACEELDHREHIDLCREQVVELLEAKSKGVDHEDEQ